MSISIKTVAQYTRQDTGKHFLDSGGVYGRVYDQGLPKELLTPDTDGFTISLTHWLAQFASINPLHQAFYKYARKEENKEMPWFEAGDTYMQEKGYTCAARDNLCNNENDFDQAFVWECWLPEDSQSDDWIYAKDAIFLIYCHTGCDVRGGYSSPLVVTFDCESGYSMPLDWVVGLHSEDLTEDENEKLQLGYSSYPLGELDEMGYIIERVSDCGSLLIAYNEDKGDTIELSGEYYA